MMGTEGVAPATDCPDFYLWPFFSLLPLASTEEAATAAFSDEAIMAAEPDLVVDFFNADFAYCLSTGLTVLFYTISI